MCESQRTKNSFKGNNGEKKVKLRGTDKKQKKVTEEQLPAFFPSSRYKHELQ